MHIERESRVPVFSTSDPYFIDFLYTNEEKNIVDSCFYLCVITHMRDLNMTNKIFSKELVV